MTWLLAPGKLIIWEEQQYKTFHSGSFHHKPPSLSLIFQGREEGGIHIQYVLSICPYNKLMNQVSSTVNISHGLRFFSSFYKIPRGDDIQLPVRLLSMKEKLDYFHIHTKENQISLFCCLDKFYGHKNKTTSRLMI